MSVKPKSKLAELRKQAGLTQVQLAALVGVTTNTIQNWEKEDGLSQIEPYLKLCEIFGLEKLSELIVYVEADGEKSKVKGFSLEQLRDIRKSWGTDIPTVPEPETGAIHHRRYTNSER